MTTAHQPPVAEIRKLRFVELRTSELADSTDFYSGAWGLDVVEQEKGTSWLRGTGSEHHILQLSDAPKNGLGRITFAVGYSPEPYLSAAWDAGMRQIIDLTEGPNNEIATSNIVAGKAFLNNNPNTTAAFSRALYAANEDILANEQEWRDWLPSIAHLDEGTAQELPMPVFFTDMDVDAVRHIAELMIDQEIVSGDYDASEFIWLTGEHAPE